MWYMWFNGPLVRFRGRPRRWLGHRRFQWHVRHRSTVYELTFVPRQGVCVTAYWWPWRVGGTSLPPTQTYKVPSMKKRQPKSAGGESDRLVLTDSSYFELLPALVEHCAIRKYDDGSVREPGMIIIKTRGSQWQVTVKEPDGECFFTTVGDTLDKALELAALLLACEECPWEPDPWAKGKGAKKRK